MILWFGVLQIVAGTAAALLCLLTAARRSGPNDFTMGATLLMAILLLIQIIVSIVQPFVGNRAVGDPLEFWLYLVLAFLMPLGAGFWALIDRTRWANVVLAIVHFSIAVMVYRMLVIWGA